jgi:5S rRNA maturation endonuclease (ribonuclease M5)
MLINQEKILENIESILDEFGISYKIHNNRLSFACPIHSGAKTNGATLYTNNGIFKCWTNHCEATYGKSILGFMRGLLSTNNGRDISIDDTIKWLEKFLRCNLSEEETRENSLKRNTIHLSLIFNKKDYKSENLIERQQVVENLQIPAGYFINRGFQADTLIKYDVGLCTKDNRQMYNRVVAPVYDDEYNFMVGCMGRTQKPQCFICNKYHNENESCPASSIDEYFSSKWINSKGFNGENYLYNFWFAQHSIKKSHTVILVEGAGDIWRLEESNIHIGLGLFGAHLTDKQAEKLEKLPIMNLIIATDNDDAGNKARALIKEKLWRQYNIFDIMMSKKDIGELSIEETKNLFNPLLEKLNVI